MSLKNRPPHIYLDNTFYFLTARTLKSIKFFNTDKRKQILLDVIKKAVRRCNYDLLAWVLLSNHYHLLLKLKKSNLLPAFMREIHANSARLLNKQDCQLGRGVWWNYWDKCLRNERDFWKHFNYLHHNPVKHGYVKKMEDYQFSSFNYWLKKKGQEWLNSCFELYPIVDFMAGEDN